MSETNLILMSLKKRYKIYADIFQKGWFFNHPFLFL